MQSNYGGVLQIAGAPVGKELGQYAFKTAVSPPGDGSIIMVIAADAPLSDRNLRRLAARALSGLARTGSSMANGSGDYVIAFATHRAVRRLASPAAADTVAVRRRELGNDESAPLFEAVIEATEEAIYNSMFAATTVSSRAGTVEAIPLDRVREGLRKYGIMGRS